jgi:hypothetical protein
MRRDPRTRVLSFAQSRLKVGAPPLPFSTLLNFVKRSATVFIEDN